MIELFYWPTPNGHKITMFLEETGLPYKIMPVNIGEGDQFKPDFLAISPNNRMPAIVDRDPAGRRRADQRVRIRRHPASISPRRPAASCPSDLRGRVEVLQWLFWQMGGLGPMAGQNHHFANTRRRKSLTPSTATSRRRTGSTACSTSASPTATFVAGDYSIADMAGYPWIVPYERQGQNLDDFPHLKRWFEDDQGAARHVRAYERAKEINTQPTMSEEARKILFGQTAAVVKA